MMEMVERWLYVLPAALIFLLATGVVLTRDRRLPFLLFLIATTGYFALARFPETANHINLLIFCNFLLIAGLIYSYFSIWGSFQNQG